jgi:hypothetical protein
MADLIVLHICDSDRVAWIQSDQSIALHDELDKLKWENLLSY